MRHAYDGMQIKLINETALDFDFCCILAEQKTIRDDDRCAAVLFEAVQDKRQEQVGSFGTLQGCREVVLD